MTGWAGVDEAVEVVEVAAPEIAPAAETRVAVAAGSTVWSAVAAAGSAARSATTDPGSVPWRAVAAAGLVA